MSKIAIILLNYNSTRLTRDCIKSLQKTKAKEDDYYIVVWDNLSSPQPASEDLPDCDLFLSPVNLGFAGGNNRAVVYALSKYRPDYLLILNNDTIVGEGMVRQMIAAFTSDPKVGMVVPKIYFSPGHEFFKSDYTKQERGRVLWYAGGGIDWRNLILFHKGVDEIDRGQFDKRETTAFAAGTAILTTPKLWKRLGGFDEAYFLYYEDADLSLRLQKMGKKIIYEPKATLFHINAGSTQGSGSTTHQYYQTRNRLRFGLQYSGIRTKVALLREAKRIWNTGTTAQRQGALHALEGKWGKQPTSQK